MSINAVNISKSFGDKNVLKNFSHSFAEGETTCVMGASGCGKTTLLSIVMGLLRPDSGELLGAEHLRKSVIFQEDRLCENISAVANLRLVRPSLTRDEAEVALSRLGLAAEKNQPVREFSGGMKRRVAILRALCAEYDLLLADEPFKGLDESTKQTVMQYFKKQTQGKTVILVTHEQAEAEFFGENILRL